MTDVATSSAYRFGRILAIFNLAVPRGLPPTLINNALALPASHYGTLAQIAGPHLDDAARNAVNEIVGDGLDLPCDLTPVQQLDIWLGYYTQVRQMDASGQLDARGQEETKDLSGVEDRHGLLV